jgi:hypothetical protein
MGSHVEILQETRERLSDINNWCSSGAKEYCEDGTERKCVYVTIGDVIHQRGTNYYAETLLCAAASEIIGKRASLIAFNDGLDEWAKIPREERHKTLLKILDRAIAIAEEEAKK